jgi:hypothetical protein
LPDCSPRARCRRIGRLCGERLDQPLRLTAIADRDASGVGAAGQRRVRHYSAHPDSRDQVFLAGDPIATPDQIHEKVEDFWLDGQRSIAATQLSSVGVQGIFIKKIEQFAGSGVAAANPITMAGRRKNEAIQRKSHDKAKQLARRAFRRPGILRSSEASPSSAACPSPTTILDQRLEQQRGRLLAVPAIEQWSMNMRNHHNRKPGSVLALGGAAIAAVAGSAVADDSMKVRPGSGDTIGLISGPAAEASLPPTVSRQQPMPVRPGFGYTIHFMTGAAAEALLPVPKP